MKSDDRQSWWSQNGVWTREVQHTPEATHWATSSLWEIRRARCCFVRKFVIKRKPAQSWHYLPKLVLTIIKNRNIVLTTDVNRTISTFSSKNCFEEINGLNRKCNILTHTDWHITYEYNLKWSEVRWQNNTNVFNQTMSVESWDTLSNVNQTSVTIKRLSLRNKNLS